MALSKLCVKPQNLPEEPEILEEFYEVIIDFQVKLKSTPLIAVTAATAPLLGLLGTVTGMIDVFRQITILPTLKTVNWLEVFLTLVTTKFGLITAIPARCSRTLQKVRVISKLGLFGPPGSPEKRSLFLDAG